MFLLNRGELEGRFDVYYYKPHFLEINKKIQNTNYELKKLKAVSSKVISGLDARDFIESGVPYLRVGNVKPLSFDLSNLKYISPTESAKDIQLQKNDLLITRKGSFGNVAIVNESVLGCVISSEVFRIPLSSNVIPEYVAIWLNTITAQAIFDRIKTGGIMGHITQDVLKDVLIPTPDLSVQQEIVDYFQKAYAEKKAKEAEAREKLASVDAIVLDALGITLPEQTKNTLEKRIFFSKSSDISSGRFDPEFVQYQHQFESKYQSFTLKQLLAKRPQYGANEMGVERISNDQLRYIRITDIDESGKLIERDLGKTAETIEEKYILQNNDLLFARSGNTVGKCYLHKDNLPYQSFFAGYMIRFVLNEDMVLPDYVFSFTQTRIYKDWIKAIKRTAGQPNINAEEYQTLKIPIPPPEVQTEIAERVEAIYSEAKKLRADGKDILEKAKRQVEAMILGEESDTL